MNNKVVEVRFFQLASGKEPVRDWLKELPLADKKIIGEDLKTVEFGWPMGMPIVRSLGNALWEVRSSLKSQRIARIIFCLSKKRMILLHGFIKKTQKTSTPDIALALKRMKQL